MHEPTYSVIIPTLNEEKFIGNLLTSLVGQSEKDFEVIVVDGSSKDKTREIVRSFQKRLPGLSLVVSEKASLPLQRNLGAKHASAGWYVFVDADSVLLPYFIQRITGFIQTQTPELFTTWFRPDSEVPGEAMITSLGNMSLDGSILLHRPFSPGPLTIVKKSAFDLVGGYDETRTFNEDVDFGLRLAKQGVTLSVLHETLCVLSLRRFRKEGTMSVMQRYIRAALPVLILKRPLRELPGYVMGGQVYKGGTKPIKKSVFQTYERKLKKLMKEVFS